MEKMDDFTLLDLFRAYFECRKNKRNSLNALEFEFDLENNLLQLYHDLKTGNYEIGQSICFVVEKPKPREVWAASFRDRIVHHLICNAIKDRFYNRFIYDSYSCIPEKGTLAAAKRVRYFSRSITRNYTKNAYYLKADLSNFFVSIDKNILFEQLKKHVPEQWILKLLKQILFHDSKSNVLVKSSKNKMELIPKYKSLWHAPIEVGLPIGNLTSQFFSNVYLNALDQYVKHNLKCKYYCRYVDDFVIFADNPQQLNKWFLQIDKFLEDNLNQRLHPNKKLINKVFTGIDFVGFIIKPNKMFIRQRTLKRIYGVVRTWKSLIQIDFEINLLENFFKTMNSYFGMLIQTSGYAIRQNLCLNIINLFLGCDNKFTKLVLNYSVGHVDFCKGDA